MGVGRANAELSITAAAHNHSDSDRAFLASKHRVPPTREAVEEPRRTGKTKAPEEGSNMQGKFAQRLNLLSPCSAHTPVFKSRPHTSTHAHWDPQNHAHTHNHTPTRRELTW